MSLKLKICVAFNQWFCPFFDPCDDDRYTYSVLYYYSAVVTEPSMDL